MTLLETLQAHKGGLLRIKSELFWYDGCGWDKNPGRICLILDAAAVTAGNAAAARTTTAAAGALAAAALLLIDGSPRWVWVAEGDVEVISEAR